MGLEHHPLKHGKVGFADLFARAQQLVCHGPTPAREQGPALARMPRVTMPLVTFVRDSHGAASLR